MDANGCDFSIVASCIYNVSSNGTGEIISGRIVSSVDGSPVGGATVTACRNAGEQWRATTDANGIYALARLPSHSAYTLTVAMGGYTTAAQEYETGASADFNCTTGDVWGANFSLEPLATNNPPLSLAAIVTVGDPPMIQITWPAVPGQNYRLDSTPDVTRGSWNNRLSGILATSNTVTVTEAIGPEPQRFYRVVAIPAGQNVQLKTGIATP
jgi:hypothetical protein